MGKRMYDVQNVEATNGVGANLSTDDYEEKRVRAICPHCLYVFSEPDDKTNDVFGTRNRI